MEIAEYSNIYHHEATHAFYQANHELIEQCIEQFQPNPDSKLHILDAGCGTGLLAKKLEKFGQVQGVDIHPEAVRFSRLRGVNAKKGSLTKLPYKANSFEIVVSVDVLYHLQVTNDVKVLQEIFRVLKPGGLLIMRVPANKWMKSAHDKHVHTRQRYEKGELSKKLQKAGFNIRKLSYVNVLFLLVAMLRQGWESLFPASQTASTIADLHPLLNALLLKITRVENYFLQCISFPFGQGLLTIANKPKAL